MIKSRKDYLYYLEADRVAKAYPKKIGKLELIKSMVLPDYVWEFQKTLRKLEYYINCKKGMLSLPYRYFLTKKHRKLSHKLGFSIPPNVFGPGLSIAHHGTVVVNAGARIGSNCRLHACVNIGTEAGYSNKAPDIGNNCYIGPGAKIYGDIYIADGTAIGANAVVNRSFNEPNTAIGGVPAKKIGDVDTFNFIIPATSLIEHGFNKNNDLKGIPAKELKEKLKENSPIYKE